MAALPALADIDALEAWTGDTIPDDDPRALAVLAAGLLAAAGFETPEAWSAAPSGTWVSREEFSRALGGGALRGPEPVTRGEALGEVLRRRTTNP